MFRLNTLHELDARVVLPVAHRLPEQRFVSAAEVAVYLVRDDAVVPDPLLACRGGPGDPPVGQLSGRGRAGRRCTVGLYRSGKR